ncbi:MAG: sulfur carrier protein ThiS adenylyltransferase ThiF [Desulfovibrio sp.]|nr:sulfur carrier protein ThiS adenylyltransferase ThiF [Desulfovibrio sp.]
MTNPLHEGLGRYFSPEQLSALHAARIGIAGAGGLGSNAALMLARSGVGHITLVDDDVVESSNLNRQQYWPRHVGRCKVEALSELLLELNPHLSVETHRLRITADTLPGILPACPIWVEALDGPDDKSLFVEGALLGGYWVASASGMGGYGGAPMSRRNLGKLVLVGDFTTDILVAPPLAPRVTEAAALLADAVLEMLLD